MKLNFLLGRRWLAGLLKVALVCQWQRKTFTVTRCVQGSQDRSLAEKKNEKENRSFLAREGWAAKWDKLFEILTL